MNDDIPKPDPLYPEHASLSDAELSARLCKALGCKPDDSGRCQRSGCMMPRCPNATERRPPMGERK